MKKIGEDLIPRLLIEPLVENAVSHGLEPKREKGNLQVLLYEREMLYIWVKDDGVGVGQNQMKAEENKENIPHTHVGWGKYKENAPDPVWGSLQVPGLERTGKGNGNRNCSSN